jgi:small subunit ribosomal protein S17
MAEEEEKTADHAEVTEDAPSEEPAPETEEAAGDTPREAADEAADVEVDEPAADEAPAEDAEPEAAAEEPEAAEPEPEAAAEEPAAPATPAAEPVEQLSPKERRHRKRGAHKGEAGPPLTVEERIQRRAEGRKSKAAERRRYRNGRGAARKQAQPSGEGTPKPERVPGNPKVRQGTVVSNKMDKTITVRVESARRHPAYEKVIRSSKMYHAHDERNEAGPGDTVRLIETRPMSKTKHWRLTEILERAE